jgi:hypothetical protein
LLDREFVLKINRSRWIFPRFGVPSRPKASTKACS